jgi:uncharacterized protein (TIGR02271 family)
VDKTGVGRQSGPDVYDETILANPEIVEGERIQLHAERPNVTRRDVRGRLAVITRRAVTVRKTFEVDVVHEELHVEYEPGDGTEMLAVEPETISVLLRAEEVEIVKRVRVVEEIFISKRSVTEQQQADVALKHERLDLLG